MAWNISKAKRQALVKLQLRDKDGKFIEMGGGVKWYSSRLKKVVAGTVVGTKGENALVRLNKENPTHEPALVSVPAASITAIEGKASLSPKGEGAPSADQTPEFEKPEAVADVEADPNAEAESDHESQLKGPQHLADNYGITETPDGNTYITRKDDASIYSPARELKVGDELIAPAGADPTKPFSIGRGWATKGTERLNKEGEGPVIGKVIAISENRYAVVQMAGGHTIADRRNPEEQTDTVTVGLSNQVILATMGLKDALGDRVSSQQYADRPSDEEKEVAPDAPEAQSDHEGREVPEDQLEAEGEAAPVDRAQVLKDMPVGGRIMTEDESQVFEKRSTNQWAFISGNGDLITDDDVLGMVNRGERDGKRFVAYEPADENAPESAPEATDAPEAQPAPDSPVEDAPEAVEEAPETEAPAEDVPEESAGAKATPVNDIVEGLAELEQVAEDVESAGLSGDEADEVLDGATFKVTAADGKTYEVSTGADENGDWNFRVADENGAEVATHIIGSEENRVLAEKIAKGSSSAKKEEAPAAEATSEAAPESTPEAPEAETYNENGLTEQEQRELASYTRLAARSYDQFKDEEGDRYKALADELLAKGEERKASAPAQSEETAPESAPEPEKAPEVTPEETKPVEDAPAPSLVEPDAAPAPEETPAADESEQGDPDFSGSASSLPVGSKVYSPDRIVEMSKVGQNQWTLDSRNGELIDDATVDGMVRRNQSASGKVYKQSVPGASSESSDSDPNEIPESGSEGDKPALNGEEGFTPIDGRGLKSKDKAEEATAPFGISFERRPDGLDHPVASNPEAMNDEENEEFARQDIALTWAQHENRRGAETTARRKLAELERRVQSRVDSESLKRQRDLQNGDTLPEEGSSDNNESKATEAPAAEAPEADPVVNPDANEDGLLPDEAARLTDLENRQAAAFRGESNEDPASFDQEISELIRHGRLRGRGREVGPFRASNPVPDKSSEQDSSDSSETPEAPAAEAPETPETSEAPRERRARGGEAVPVADADGNMVTRGDKIGHPTLGPVEITNTLPGSGRVEFIDPTTGRKKSVKAARVRKIDPNAAEAAPEEQPTTADPGTRFVDAATGKQGFGDKSGNRVLVGDRVRDANGNTGTVKSVYTAANGGAWIPVQWDNDGKTRRVMGNVLEKDDSSATPAPEATPETAPEATPEPIEVVRPSATPAPAPERVEPAEEPFEPVLPSATPSPAPEAAPEVATEPEETHEEGTARRQALVDTTPVNAKITSQDGSQNFYKISDTQWQFNEGNLLTPTAVVNMMALGERRGISYDIAEGRPAEVNKPVAQTPAVDAPQAPAGTALDPAERERRIGMLRQLPPGTTIKPRSGEYTLTKNGSDDWSSTVDDGVYDTEDIYGIVESGRAGGLLYEVTRPTTPAEPTVVALEPDSLVPPTTASREAAFKRAPVGTTVTSPDGSKVFTKQADNEWVSETVPGTVIIDSFLAVATDSDTNGHWIFNKTPEASEEQPEGTNVSALSAMDALRAFRQAPVGSVLKAPRGVNVITKVGERLWTNQLGEAIDNETLVSVSRTTDVTGPWGIVLPTVPYVPTITRDMALPESREAKRALLETAPVGSVVHSPQNPTTTYTKLDSGYWVSSDNGFEFSAGSMVPLVSNRSSYVINPPVALETPRPIPQDLASRVRVSEEAPIGTIVTSSMGESYTKISDTEWADTATLRNFRYRLGEFATKLKNNPYTGEYFVQGFDVPDIETPSAFEGVLPANRGERAEVLLRLPIGSMVGVRGYFFEKTGDDLWDNGNNEPHTSEDVSWAGSEREPGTVTQPSAEFVPPTTPFEGGPLSANPDERDWQISQIPDGGSIVGGRNGTRFIRRGADTWSPENNPEEYYNDSDIGFRVAEGRTTAPVAEMPDEAPEVAVIHDQLPVGTFLPRAEGGTGGLKRVGPDKWEMIKDDGTPSGRFATDETVQMFQELIGTSPVIPVDNRFGENVGMYAEDLKLPGGKSLGKYLEDGGTFGRLTETQKNAIREGYQKFIDNLNTQLPEGFRAELASNISFNSNSMTTYTQFYQGNRALGAAERRFSTTRDSRTNKVVSSVEHAFWQLADDVQGSGLSAVFLNASKQMYRQMGLDRITVHADISVGSYAWARGGFDFRSASYMASAIRAWESRIGTAPAGREAEWAAGKAEFFRLKALATPAAFKNGTHPPAVAFANIGRPKNGDTGPDAIWLGKEILQHTHWYGDFMLNSAAPSGTVAPSA